MRSNETKGVAFVLASTVLWGAFPVVVHQGAKNLPPLTFAALSIAVAVVVLFLYTVLTGKLSELRVRAAYKSTLMVSLCIVSIPTILFFVGAKLTSGANTALLGLAEIAFTVIMTPWFGEKNTRAKLLGAGGVLIGGALIMYNGSWKLNIGDVLIVGSTVLYPIGNFYAKRALTIVSDSVLLFGRFLLALIPVSIAAVIFEHNQFYTANFYKYWPYIILTGVAGYVIEKLLWYKGLRHLDISKAVTLANSSPLISLALLIGFFHESITLYQWIGLVVMLAGVFFAVSRTSTPLEKTRYGVSIS